MECVHACVCMSMHAHMCTYMQKAEDYSLRCLSSSRVCTLIQGFFTSQGLTNWPASLAPSLPSRCWDDKHVGVKFYFCASVYQVLNLPQFPRRPEEGVRFLGVGVTGACELLSVGAANQIPILWETASLLNRGAIPPATCLAFLYGSLGLKLSKRLTEPSPQVPSEDLFSITKKGAARCGAVIMPVIPVVGRLRQEDPEFQDSLSST